MPTLQRREDGVQVVDRLDRSMMASG